MRSSSSWWGSRVRQARAHVTARVAPAERAEVATWLSPAELDLFDAMPVADRRHGLDVVTRLRSYGAHDPDLLVAGLLHDCGKGAGTRLWHRVGWSLGERYGTWVHRSLGVMPGYGSGLERMRVHAERSAELMAAAGVSDRAVDLVRHQADPADPILGGLLLVADEAS
jgi:hypothetical protein